MWSEERNGRTRYQERYTDYVTGKARRVSVTLDGKDTAQNRRIAADLLRLKMAAQPTRSETLGGLMEKYNNYQANTVKASTSSRNRLVLGKVVNHIGYDAKIDRLTVGYIINALIGMEGTNITRNEHIKRLKAMFRWGLNMGIHENHALVTIPTLPTDTSKKERIADKFLEPEEVHAILDYFEEHGLWRWWHLTRIMVLSGLRCGELVALDDADVDSQYIHVTKTYDPINKVITSTKTTTSTRDVFIQGELADAIRLYRAWRREDLFKHGARSALFAPYSNGNRINYYSFNKELKKASTAKLGRSVTTHALRHTHASLLFAEGLTLDEISRRLGHSDSQVTREVYLHQTEKLKERDAERLQDLKII
jgi:integrase